MDAIGKVITLICDVDQCKSDIEALRSDIKKIRSKPRDLDKEMRHLSTINDHFMYRTQSEHEKLLLCLEVAFLNMGHSLTPADTPKVIKRRQQIKIP
jgi:hypothetical protein